MVEQDGRGVLGQEIREAGRTTIWLVPFLCDSALCSAAAVRVRSCRFTKKFFLVAVHDKHLYLNVIIISYNYVKMGGKRDMQLGGMVGGILFVIGIVAIFTSGGNTTNMVVGDALIFVAGVAIMALGRGKPA